MRRLRGPALMTLAMIAVLCGLGAWQLQRLEWKRGILAAIDQAERSPPVPLPANPARFQKVQVTGTLRPDLALRYGVDVHDTPLGPVLGSQLIEPLIRPNAPPVLIDRGWVPESIQVPTPPGEVTLTGYARPPENQGLFSVKDDAPGRRFYTLNPAVMGAAIALQVAPTTIVLLGPDTSTPPVPATALPRPPNDHLGYALTWFGLAIVMLVMFLSWVRSEARRGALPPRPKLGSGVP